MPSKSVHSAIISKKRYPEYRYAKNKFGDGIHVLWGIDENGKVHVASIKFDKDKFRGDDAKYWLKEHDYVLQWFVDAEEEGLSFAVYHGSPHAFDKFTTEKIGTGEGAQAYGWGLYFTDKKEIAEYYAKEYLTKELIYDENKLKVKAEIIYNRYKEFWEYRGISYNSLYGMFIKDLKEDVSKWKKSKSDILEAINEKYERYKDIDIDEYKRHRFSKSNRDDASGKIWFKLYSEFQLELLEDIEIKESARPHIYKVKIHGDKDINELNFLDWDKPIKEEQRNIIKNIFGDFINRETDFKRASELSRYFESYDFNNKTGREIYDEIIKQSTYQRSKLESKYGSDVVWGQADKIASLILLDNGFDGIKYCTGDTRDKGCDAYNYVIFDEKAVEIKEHQMYGTGDYMEKGNMKIEEHNLEGLSDKMLAKRIIDNFQEIRDFADKTYPVPVDTRLGLTTINIYDKNKRTVIGQINLESGEIFEGQIDLYSGSVETDAFLPYTKRLRDFIMQPGKMSVKEQEQAQLFGIGKIASQSREERWIKLNNRFEWIKNRLSDARRKKIEEPLLKAKELLGIELNCEVTEKSLLISGDSTKIATQTENIPAYYAIAELFYLQPSHNYQDYSKNQCYPENCQTRDYSGDKVEKEKILRIIRDFDPIHLVTDNPSALEGPPVITEPGIVLGGNSRSIALQILAKDTIKYDSMYLPALKKKIDGFGFSKNALSKFRNPVLVRIIDIPLSKCSTYSNMLNKGPTQEMNEVTEAIALARQLEEKHGILEKIASAFDNAEDVKIIDEKPIVLTFRDMMKEKEVAETLIGIMQSTGIITPSNQNHWLRNNNTLSEVGMSELEFALLGTILRNQTLIEEIADYKQKILKALPQFLKINSLPGKWNIIPNVQDAIEHEYHQRHSASKNREKYLTQTSITGQVEELTALIWKILEKTDTKDLRIILNKYYQTAKTTLDSMFESDKKQTPEEILNFYYKKLEKAKAENKSLSNLIYEADNSTLNTQHSTLLGDVVAVPDADLTAPELKIDDSKEQIGNSKEPKADEVHSTLNTQHSTLPDEGLPQLPTTTDIMNAVTKGKPLILKRTKPLLNRLLEPFSMLIYGKAGHGKTSLGLILAEDLEPNGKSLYILADKGTIDTRLKEQIERLKIHKDITFYPSKDWANPGVENYLNDEAFKFIIIDKTNDVFNIKQEEFKDLIEKYPNKSFIYIARTNKAGKEYIGDPELAFKVDTIVLVENMTARTIEKHRDGEVGKSLPVMETKNTWDWKENMAKAS